VVDGGAGTDLVTYLLDVVATGITVDLGAGTVTGGAGTDSLISVEQVTGSTADDSLTGSSAANQLFGVGGNDSLSGLDGNDYLAGGAGNDAHDGGLGTDVCQDSSGTNTFTSCESTPAIAERIVTSSGQTAEAAEISYELSVGRWVAQQEALARAALRAARS
jgi:Ca2+-binding RTX toxin-like protein